MTENDKDKGDSDSPADLAAQAGKHFREKSNDKALECLKKVLKQKEDDPKVLQNVAIAEYYLGGCREPQKLLDVLEKLKQRVDEARAQQESGDGSGELDYREEMDPSLTAYNTAVIYFQLKQYAKCRVILEEMFSNIEPIDEFLAFKICFLLLDVYLLHRQTEKGAEVLSYLEKSFNTLNKSDKPEKEKAPGENGVPEKVDGADGKVAGYVASALDSATLSGDWPNKKSTRPSPTAVTPAEVKLSLHLYKAKLHLLNRSMKSSKREIKSALNSSSQNPTALFLKSNLEYLRQNYRKAIKLLNSCQKNGNDPNLPALYFNNMGCIHHCMRKYHAASYYFTRALQENDSLFSKSTSRDAQDGGVSLSAFSCDHRSEVLYNKGLQLLITSQPHLAYACFQEALLLLYSLPRIWLRLGECCVGAEVLKEREQQEKTRKQGHSEMIRGTVGSSNSRRVLLPLSNTPTETDAEAAATPTAPSASNSKVETLSLEYGAKCFRNAIYLCSWTQQSTTVAMASAPSASADSNHSSPPSAVAASDDQTGELVVVRQLALLNLAWTALSQGDAVVALSCAEDLLATKDCTSMNVFFAHLYAGEALCLLNRTSEAVHHLSPALLGDSYHNNHRPPTAEGIGDEAATDGTTPSPYCSIPQVPCGLMTAGARCVLYTNLATVHITQDDLNQAQQCVQQALALDPHSSEAMLLMVYIEVRNGNSNVALQILKKNRPPPPGPSQSL